MNERTVTTVIDPEVCIGCGQCVRVCPSQTLSLKNGKARVTGDASLGCGHCEAICPTGAVRVGALENDAQTFKTLLIKNEWLPFGECDASELIRLMRSRRSCRNYTEKPVPPAMLEDLVKAGVSAPSGTNSQQWTFTVIPSRNKVMVLAEAVGLFFKRLNRLSEKKWLRLLLKWVGKPTLDHYYREYYDTVKEAVRLFEEEKVDQLFHGATAVILAGSKPGASCPKEDALLATQNILLAAHAMGLGTCLIGFVVEAMKQDKTIQRRLGIPGDERIYSAIGVGYPDEKYLRLTGRKKFVMRKI